jgi:hypothetical protein
MAILPVWLWTVALAGERSRAVRTVSTAIVGVALVSSAFLLASRREPPVSTVALERIERIVRPGDALVAGAHFFLPARLAADRGRLPIPVHAFPAEQATHPGWSAPVRLRPEDLARVKSVLDRTSPAGRVFFELPPSYSAALRSLLLRHGVLTEILRTGDMVVLAWSRPPRD